MFELRWIRRAARAAAPPQRCTTGIRWRPPASSLMRRRRARSTHRVRRSRRPPPHRARARAHLRATLHLRQLLEPHRQGHARRRRAPARISSARFIQRPGWRLLPAARHPQLLRQHPSPNALGAPEAAHGARRIEPIRLETCVHALLTWPIQRTGVNYACTPAERAAGARAQAPRERRAWLRHRDRESLLAVLRERLSRSIRPVRKARARAQRYVRYVDDFVLVHRDRRAARGLARDR
jgi:hypothetical protein